MAALLVLELELVQSWFCLWGISLCAHRDSFCCVIERPGFLIFLVSLSAIFKTKQNKTNTFSFKLATVGFQCWQLKTQTSPLTVRLPGRGCRGEELRVFLLSVAACRLHPEVTKSLTEGVRRQHYRYLVLAFLLGSSQQLPGNSQVGLVAIKGTVCPPSLSLPFSLSLTLFSPRPLSPLPPLSPHVPG